MPVIFKNNAASTLGLQAQLSDSTITVANGTGNRFPAPVSGEWFYATIQSGVNWEIVKCTSRAGDVLMVDRAQDGSLARLWGVGASIDMRIPNIVLESFLQSSDASEVGLALFGAADESAARVAIGATATGEALITAANAAAARGAISAAAADRGTPVGVVMAYAGSTAPAGWLLCAGQSVSRATYADLFGILQTTYGSVDGNSFNLPDLRGRSVFGKDNMGGTAAGRITNAVSGVDGLVVGAAGGSQSSGNTTLTVDQMPSHTHSGTASSGGDHSHWTWNGDQVGPGNNLDNGGRRYPVRSLAGGGFDEKYVIQGNGTPPSIGESSVSGAHSHTVNINAIGGGQPHNHTAMPPTMILNYIIKT
jgi:microcystin-dependent protein